MLTCVLATLIHECRFEYPWQYVRITWGALKLPLGQMIVQTTYTKITGVELSHQHVLKFLG